MKTYLTAISFFIFTTGVYAQAPLKIDASVTKRAITSDTVVYNLSNGKMHTHDCEWAEKCTKNCIFVHKNELDSLFYIPCLVCGGNVFLNNEEEE